MLLTISLFLAMLLGFSAHRAGICTVRAVAEIVSTGRAHMLFSFAKTVLWVMAVTMPLVWWLPIADVPTDGTAPATIAVFGGFLFGVGAALNEGCAFSTLARLADGQVRMVLSLVGFCLGVLAYLSLAAASAMPFPVPVPAAYRVPEPWSLAVLAGLWTWIAWEAGRLWRTRDPGSTWAETVLANRYRLSTAAALMGISNGVLYAIHGSWAYTSTLSETVERLVGLASGPSALQVVYFVLVLAGMAFSTWQRGSFRLDWRPSYSWARNLMGGLLMGLGAAMVPGGNDVLVLHGIPGLAPNAVVAYGGVLAGVAMVLIMMRMIAGKTMRMDCSGDICKAR